MLSLAAERDSSPCLKGEPVPHLDSGMGEGSAQRSWLCPAEVQWHIKINPILLGARLSLILLVDQAEGAFSHERARDNHHANEAARTVGSGLCEDRLRPALEPSAAGAVGRGMAVCVDADAPFDQAANTGSLVGVQIGETAGRERDAVTAQEQFAGRQGDRRGELLTRTHAVTAGGAVARAARYFPAPAGRTGLVRPQHDGVFTVPSLTAVHAAIANPECAMHDEYDTRKRRQPSLAAARQCVLVKPKHGLHDASP